MKAWHAKLEERARRRRAQANKTANDRRGRQKLKSAKAGWTDAQWEEYHAICDGGATSKDGSPPSKSSDDRPTKQQKRPTHEDIPDETAVQLSSGPTYKVSAVKISLRDRSCPAFSLRDHLQGRE